ncbi:MAG TPA: hypothetical protein V6C97_21360 [Oculatellaceae cyanobacterium]
MFGTRKEEEEEDDDNCGTLEGDCSTGEVFRAGGGTVRGAAGGEVSADDDDEDEGDGAEE